jgi:ankyrin repeat protein
MLQRGVDIESRTTTTYRESLGATALHIACKSWADDMVGFLLTNKADPRVQDANQQTPLHLSSLTEQWCGYPVSESSYKGAVNICKLLLDSAPDMINVRDKDGNTPFLCATKSISTMLPIVQLMGERGADVATVNNRRENALYQAAFGDDGTPSKYPLSSGIQYLVQNGVDIEGRCILGATPLIRACISENLEAIHTLLCNGADVNAKCHRPDNNNVDGKTSLHMAYSRRGTQDVIKILLEYGADLKIKDGMGRIPVDCIPVPKPHMGRGRGIRPVTN